MLKNKRKEPESTFAASTLSNVSNPFASASVPLKKSKPASGGIAGAAAAAAATGKSPSSSSEAAAGSGAGGIFGSTGGLFGSKPSNTSPPSAAPKFSFARPSFTVPQSLLSTTGQSTQTESTGAENKAVTSPGAAGGSAASGTPAPSPKTGGTEASPSPKARTEPALRLSADALNSMKPVNLPSSSVVTTVGGSVPELASATTTKERANSAGVATSTGKTPAASAAATSSSSFFAPPTDLKGSVAGAGPSLPVGATFASIAGTGSEKKALSTDDRGSRATGAEEAATASSSSSLALGDNLTPFKFSTSSSSATGKTSGGSGGSPVRAAPVLEEQPLVTGEEDELTLMQCRARLFTIPDKQTGAWVERGVGVVRVKSSKNETPVTYRIVMRQEGVHKLILNARIWPQMSVQKTGDRFLRLLVVDEDKNIRPTLIQTGNAELLDNLFDEISKAKRG